MKQENTSHSSYNLRTLYEYLDTATSLKDYVSLVSGAKFTKQGRTWKCKSPLNSGDKNPSFTITDGKHVFYCFSTGYGGNIVSFAERYYGIDRDQAIGRIASDLGLDLSEYLNEEIEPVSAYIDVLTMTLRYCVAEASRSTRFKEFFEDRGIGLLNFLIDNNIGFCHSASSLGDHLVSNGCDASIVDKLGLLDEVRMSNSLVFPVYNHHKQLVRLVCRPLDGQTKYVNTIEFSEYNSEVIMGMESIGVYSGKPLIAVEGPIDYLALKYQGHTNVVAMCGLKLPMGFLKRISDLNYGMLYLWVDGDVAGRGFAIKVFDNLSEYGKYGTIIKLIHNYDSDPDDYIRTHTVDEVIKESVYLPIWVVLQKSMSISDSDLCKALVVKYGTMLTGVGYVIYLEWASSFLSVPKDVLHSLIASASVAIPVDLDLEKQVLSVIISNPFFAVNLDITSEIFHSPVHKKIVDMVLIDGMSYDVMVHSNRGNQQVYDVLVSLPQVQTSGINEIVKTLKYKSVFRQLQSIVFDTLKSIPSASDSPDDIIQDLEDKILALQNKTEVQIEQASSVLVQIMDELATRNDGNLQRMFLLGDRWTKMNAVTYGIVPGKLIIVQGPTGHGKTTMVLNWVDEVTINNNVPCLFLSGEMDKIEIIKRLVSIQTGINSTNLSFGGINDSDMTVMVDLIRAGKGFDKLFVDTTMDFNKAVNLIKYSVKRHGIRYVVIDYIQLMDISGGRFKDMQGYEKYKEASRQFKILAQQLNIAVILLGQQNDDALDDKTPVARRLAGAKAMNNDADVSIAFRKKTQKEMDADGLDQGNLLVNIDKVRYNMSQVVFNAYVHPGSLRMKEII